MVDVKELISLFSSPTKEDIRLIRSAHAFAKKAHQGHTRFSGEPYFVHVFETAKTLVELGMSSTTVAAGLLHDTIEDVGVEPDQIREKFGDEVLFLVEGVTKLGKIKYRGVDRHNESLRKLMVAMSQDIRVLVIRLADRLHNLKTLQYVPKEKQSRIAGETLEIYVPIAYRLGIRKLSRELEDLCFPYLFPEQYKEINDLVKQVRKKYAESMEKFRRSIWKVLLKEKMSVISVDYRIKNLYSIYQKYLRRDKDINKIHDIIALRIIVPSIGDCYSVLGIIHKHWRPLPGRIKDYIATPKANGYQSLHTTVFIGDGSTAEVQIKTQQMHQESEYGIASHISYKEGHKSAFSGLSWIRYLLPYTSPADQGHKNLPGVTVEDSKDVPQWVKEMVEYQSQIKGSRKDFVDDLKTDFFQRRIFVFTPNGDAIDLPIGATPIDFAYAIHSDIGHHLFGAKVNGKMVSLNTNLKGGDVVEIQTKASSKPTEKWLQYAVTTLALRKIRAALSEEESRSERQRLSKDGKSK